MLQLPLDEAAQHLQRLRDDLVWGDQDQTATLTEDGRPVLAVMPWTLYEALMELVQVPTDPLVLLEASASTRRLALTIAAARAEHLYRTDPDLTDFETFGDDDLFGTPMTVRHCTGAV